VSSHRPLNALVICNGYPSEVSPISGSFIAQQVKWLRTLGVSSVVVNPVRFNVTRDMLTPSSRMGQAWSRWAGGFRVPVRDEVNGQPVHHPRVMTPPGALSTLAVGELLYARLSGLFMRLVAEHRPDVIHSHFLVPNAYVGQLLAQDLGVPHVASVMGCDATVYGLRGGGRRVTRRALRRVDGIITKSAALRDAVIDLYDADARRVRVIPNGVDLERFTAAPKAPGKGSLLFVGSFYEPKDIPGNLLPAVAALAARRRDFTLHMVGDGPDRARTEAEIARLDLGERVVLHGRKPHAELADYFHEADLFVLSSSREGTPNVVMESLAAGVPVISTDVGGVRDVTNEEVAILTPPRDPAALAEALEAGLDRQWDRRAVRAYAEQHLDIRVKVAEIRALYDDVIAARRRR
jgi:teichuronic acid biosynthesis glycosyltransferase TuaC